MLWESIMKDITFEMDFDNYVGFYHAEIRGRTFQVVEIAQGKARRWESTVIWEKIE